MSRAVAITHSNAKRCSILIPGTGVYHGQSATSGKARSLKKVEPLKADKCCELLKVVHVYTLMLERRLVVLLSFITLRLSRA
jgi:hypothetical protein